MLHSTMPVRDFTIFGYVNTLRVRYGAVRRPLGTLAIPVRAIKYA